MHACNTPGFLGFPTNKLPPYPGVFCRSTDLPLRLLSGDMSRNFGRHMWSWLCASKEGCTSPWLVILALPLFLAMMPPASPSRPLPLPSQHNMTCETVQPPFGNSSMAFPAFKVICGPNKEPLLPIGSQSYKIDYISLEGYISIFAGPIHQVCYASDGTPTETIGTSQMDLAGTPFTFSTRNKLTAIGCNYRIWAYLKDRGDNPWGSTGFGCSTSCHGSASLDRIINGSCSGLACCQIEVPMHGAQMLNLSFYKTTTTITPEEDGTCSAAFFLDQDQQVFPDFTSNASAGMQRPLKDVLVPPGERKMTLEWAAGRNSCPACDSKSVCSRAPGGVGYLCQCRSGYAGNPYLEGGCSDIDECRDTRDNPCEQKCTNTNGSYNCSCPPGMIGDGKRSGTGCKFSASAPSGSPSPTQPQGLNRCLDPDKNPCVHFEHCIDEQGPVLCTCPRGMRGDGMKNGNGCQNNFTDIMLGVPLALVATMTSTSLCYYWSMKRRHIGRKRAELFRKNGGLLLQQRYTAFTSKGIDSTAKIFSAAELQRATNNYNESRIIGRGGHGTVYKGVLPDKTVVAVKKSTVFDESQVEQFVNEITIVSQIDHPNVVRLLGCCLETQVPLLVYEFISNGTLSHHINNRRAPHSLTWEDCLRIAAETAEALAYLHSAPSMPIIHRDIKSTNILLDESYVAKISDFGASRSVPFDQTHITTLVQGTIGYLDPEYFQNSQLTEKSDVYSFGVVLAELLTRQKPVSLGRPEELRNLAMYLVMLVDEGCLLQVIEPHILEEAGAEQLHAFAQLSRRCLNVKGEERPAMKEVASVLDGLRRSCKKKQTVRRDDEAIHRNNEEEERMLGEGMPSCSSIYSSEESRQYRMEVEIL